MKLAFPNRSAGFHCCISAVALGGSLAGWLLWSVSGSWQRSQHFGEEMLWSASVIIGLWTAVNAIHLSRARGSEGVNVAIWSTLLVMSHLLSLLLLLTFVNWLVSGGPWP